NRPPLEPGAFTSFTAFESKDHPGLNHEPMERLIKVTPVGSMGSSRRPACCPASCSPPLPVGPLLPGDRVLPPPVPSCCTVLSSLRPAACAAAKGEALPPVAPLLPGSRVLTLAR